MGRLRVAFVAPSLRILGGQAVQADRLLKAWRDDADVDAWLVAVNPEPPALLGWTSRVKYLRTVINELVYGPELLRQLSRADIVHVFSASYTSFLLAPLPAIVIARALGRPVLLNYRSGEAPDHLTRSAIARAALARVDANVVPSRFLVDVFDRFGIEATVIPNVVDPDRFSFRERHPLRPRLVCTRNFDALYNVACTLRAFQIVQARHSDATLTLVGGGRGDRELRSLVDTLGLRNVTFAGRVAPDDMPAYYHANDIYVQSPRIDNMPTSVIEAFACGLPVVSTRVGGIPAIVTHDVNGLLATDDDHEELAAHVLRLLDDPPLVQRLTHAAQASSRACTWSAVRESWLAVYQRVLRTASSRQPFLARSARSGRRAA
jgi:glycosyltransferase involved in cell wall biosynthesis